MHQLGMGGSDGHRLTASPLDDDAAKTAQQYARVARTADQWVALSLMQRGRVIEVDLSLALEACTLGLPLADSLIYATARWHGAVLWTQDGHFEGLVGVQYFRKP
jgi:toxin FitB